MNMKKTKSRKIIYEKYPEYIAADTLDPINMDPDAYKVVYTVRVRLIKRTIGINYNCPLNNLIDIQENFCELLEPRNQHHLTKVRCSTTKDKI